jgi:hypothetical protein
MARAHSIAEIQAQADDATRVLSRSGVARWSVRAFILVGATMYLLWGLLARPEPGAVDPFGERIAIEAFALALFGVSFVPRVRPHLSYLAYSLAIVGIGHLFLLAARNGLQTRYVLGIIMVLAATMPFFARLSAAAVYGVFVLGAAVAVAALAPGVPAGEGLHFAARVGTVLVATWLVAWRTSSFAAAARRALVDKIAQLESARAEVKHLQGLLPICMHCKKIRDDQNSWQRLELYIEAHSEAQFSHGLCDECLAQHYPPDDPALEDGPTQRRPLPE